MAIVFICAFYLCIDNMNYPEMLWFIPPKYYIAGESKKNINFIREFLIFEIKCNSRILYKLFEKRRQ